jgi:hypothetical protein
MFTSRGYQAIKDEVEGMHAITSSTSYQNVMRALQTLAPYATWLADNIPWWLVGHGELAEPLRIIEGAYSSMAQFEKSSEDAYHAIQAFDLVFRYLQYAMYIGLFLLIVGGIILMKAAEKSK